MRKVRKIAKASLEISHLIKLFEILLSDYYDVLSFVIASLEEVTLFLIFIKVAIVAQSVEIKFQIDVGM